MAQPAGEDGSMPSTSGRGSGQESSYTCCAGVAYFTRAMAKAGESPRCLGLQRVKRGELAHDEAQTLPNGARDFQFVCMGYTAHSKDGDGNLLPYCEGVELLSYEEPQGQHANTRGGSLAAAPPLYERHAQAKAKADAQVHDPPLAGRSGVDGRVPTSGAYARSQGGSTPSPSSGGRGTTGGGAGGGGEPSGSDGGGSKGFYERLWLRADQNMAAMSAMLQNKGPIRMASFESLSAVQERLLRTSSDNVRRLENAASLASAYVGSTAASAWASLPSFTSSGSSRSGSDSGGRARGQ